MPTENRSSNTEQMVSVPRVPTDEMIVAFAEAWYSKRQAIDDPDMLDAYKAMLAAAPAAQHQGEPVACVEVGADRNACVTITDNDWLRDLKDKGAHQIVPLYTHADAGEVERLRKELLLAETQAAYHRAERDTQNTKLNGVRAQLAERDALLREAKDELSRGNGVSRPCMAEKIRLALSANAEPISPKCKHAACKSLGEHHPFCDFVQAIEPSAPVERDQGIPGTSFQRVNTLANQGG